MVHTRRHRIYELAGGRVLYPFHLMNYGDWVIVPKRLVKRASSAAYMYGTRHRVYFRCRKFGTQGRIKIIRLSTYFIPRARRGETRAQHD